MTTSNKRTTIGIVDRILFTLHIWWHYHFLAYFYGRTHPYDRIPEPFSEKRIAKHVPNMLVSIYICDAWLMKLHHCSLGESVAAHVYRTHTSPISKYTIYYSSRVFTELKPSAVDLLSLFLLKKCSGMVTNKDVAKRGLLFPSMRKDFATDVSIFKALLTLKNTKTDEPLFSIHDVRSIIAAAIDCNLWGEYNKYYYIALLMELCPKYDSPTK